MSRTTKRPPVAFFGVACALAVLTTCISPALAQGRETVDLQKMLVTAYSLRRRGNFRAAAAAYELVLSKLKKKDKATKRLLAKELAEMFLIMGKPEKAVLLYRRNNDVANEIKVLLSMEDAKRHSDAQRVSEFVNYPRGHALALARQGRTNAALKLMKKKGLTRERADLLVELKRYAEAAPLYETLQEFYLQARALRLAGKKRTSQRAYEDAITQLRFLLRDENGNLQRVKTIARFHKDAPDGVTRERTRLALAKAYGRLGNDFRQLAESYALSGREDYGQKAPVFAANALKYLKKQKTLYEDANGGGDSYGAAAVKFHGIDATIAEVQAEGQSYQR